MRENKQGESTHKNRACHGWSGWYGILWFRRTVQYVLNLYMLKNQTYNIASAPCATGSELMQRFRLFSGQCALCSIYFRVSVQHISHPAGVSHSSLPSHLHINSCVGEGGITNHRWLMVIQYRSPLDQENIASYLLPAWLISNPRRCHNLASQETADSPVMHN